MTDRLTPPQLRDLADLCALGNRVVTLTANGETTRFYPNKDLAYVLREEAARREAEAKPVKIYQPECHEPGGCIASVACVQFGKCSQKPEAAPQGEREGPGSAAAPTVEGLVAHAEVTADGELRLVTEEPDYEPPTFAHRETWEIVALAANQIADLLLNQNDPRYALLHEFANKLGERSEELKEYAKTLPFRSEHKVEDKPAPAADELRDQRDEWIHRAHVYKFERDSLEIRADKAEARVRELNKEVNDMTAQYLAVTHKHSGMVDKWNTEKARADRLAAAVADHVKYLEATGGPIPTVLWDAITTKGGDRG